MKSTYIPLLNRAVIKIAGTEGISFLQGLISNDINKISDKKSIYALLLTPQGKYFCDFFITKMNNDIFLDCPAENVSDVIAKLTIYRLRSDVNIVDVSNKYEVVSLLGDRVFEKIDVIEEGETFVFCKGVVFLDPRSTKMFARSIVEKENDYQSFKVHDFVKGEFADYEKLRIENTIVDGVLDMEKEKSFPLQFNMNEMNAIDYKKGCYVGQEVTARSFYKGKNLKKIYRVSAEQILPKTKEDIILNNKKIGTLTSIFKNIALAQLDGLYFVDNKDIDLETESGIKIQIVS